MKYTHIIWDWNGTLLNDAELCMNTMNEILQQRGLKTIASIEEYRNLFCFPVSDYYDKLGFDYENESFETLARIFTKRANGGAYDCPLFSGAQAVLSALSEAGKTQIILSATEINALSDLISHHGLTLYFDKLFGLCDHYAVSKIALGMKYIKEHGIDSRSTLLIGDTVHDYEVAQTLGCDCFLIPNGHQSLQCLSVTGAKIVYDISDIVKYA